MLVVKPSSILKIFSVVVITALFSLPMHAAAYTEKSWTFKVFLDDREIGKHAVRVVQNQDSKKVSVDANFQVKFLFFTAYQYQHSAEEVWEGSCLKHIEVTTDDNGNNLFVRKMPEGGEFVVETHSGTQNLGNCVRSFAYWDLDLLRAEKLLNTQTGDYEPVEIIELGEDRLEVDGQVIDSLRYQLVAGEKVVDLWYTVDKDWLALKSVLDDGYLLSYLPDNLELR